jgi:hypothetical protein
MNPEPKPEKKVGGETEEKTKSEQPQTKPLCKCIDQKTKYITCTREFSSPLYFVSSAVPDEKIHKTSTHSWCQKYLLKQTLD